MRLAVSAAFISAAMAAGRTVERKVYVKKTNSRSEALSSGTQIDVSDYISKNNFPTINSALEINLNQYSADKITLTGLDPAWWNTNIFSYANFLEVRVDFIINGLTADTITVFSGWIEKKGNLFVYTTSIKNNNVKFAVWSYQDYAGDVQAASLLTQYVNSDIDGAATEGLILPTITGLFVTDATNLQKGFHTISYQLSGADKQAKFDDGAFVTLSGGGDMLENADATQSVDIYASDLLPETGEYSCDIIVDNEGDPFPKTWYHGINARTLLDLLFPMTGITTLSYDHLDYPTADGLNKVSPVDNLTGTKNKFAIATVGSYLFYGENNKIYRRNMTTGVVDLRQTLTAIGGYDEIVWMFYNARNDQLWCFQLNGYIQALNVTANTIVGRTFIAPTGNSGKSLQLIDVQNVDTTWEYAILYYQTGGTNYVKRYDCTSFAVTNLNATGYEIDSPTSIWFPSAKKYFVRNYSSSAYQSFAYNTTTKAWAYSVDITVATAMDNACYHPTEDRIYFYEVAGGIEKISSHPFGSTTITNIVSNLGASLRSEDYFSAMHYSSVYDAVITATASEQKCYELKANAAHQVGNINGFFTSLCTLNDRVYGIDELGRLYQVFDEVNLYLSVVDLEGMKVRDAIDKTCKSFSLLYKITSNKTARVQRRSDQNGTPINSGNSVELNADNARDITETSFFGDAYDIINITNGTKTINYNGSVYDAVSFLNEKVLPIDSDWIPDEIMEDLAFNLYLFFSEAHRVWDVSCPAGLLQYEPMDGATLVYNGAVVYNETVIIIGNQILPDSRVVFKVMSTNE